jgi:hypothetical protein
MKNPYPQYNYVGAVLKKAKRGGYGANAKAFFQSNYSKEKKKSFISRIFKK